MNSLVRYNAMLDGQPVDFVPRIPILMQFAAEHIDALYGAFCSDFAVKAEGNVRCAEDFGLDLVGVMSDPYTETEGFGAEIIFKDKTTPECRHPPLADSRELSKLPRPNPLQATRMLSAVRTVERYREQFGGQYTILGWVEGPAAEAADLRGIGQFLMDLIDDPIWAGELMDLCVDVAIDYAQAQVNAGADTIGVGDAIASQVSYDMYARLIQPREKRLMQAIRDMGARVRLHICGNTTHLLEGIADLPVDVLDVDHMVDIATARERLPKTVTLGANLDPVTEVMQSNPASIRQALYEAYAKAGNPFVVNAGCEIPPGTPDENLRALCEPLPYHN
jgi:MtaA/CmuA family methyltransferase